MRGGPQKSENGCAALGWGWFAPIFETEVRGRERLRIRMPLEWDFQQIFEKRIAIPNSVL